MINMAMGSMLGSSAHGIVWGLGLPFLFRRLAVGLPCPVPITLAEPLAILLACHVALVVAMWAGRDRGSGGKVITVSRLAAAPLLVGYVVFAFRSWQRAV